MEFEIMEEKAGKERIVRMRYGKILIDNRW